MADPKDDKLEFENNVTFIIVVIWSIIYVVLCLSALLGYFHIRSSEVFFVFPALFFLLVGNFSQFWKNLNFMRDNKVQIFISTFVMPFIFVIMVYDLYSNWIDKIDEIHRGIKSIAKIQEIQGDFNIEKARQNIIIGKP